MYAEEIARILISLSSLLYVPSSSLKFTLRISLSVPGAAKLSWPPPRLDKTLATLGGSAEQKEAENEEACCRADLLQLQGFSAKSMMNVTNSWYRELARDTAPKTVRNSQHAPTLSLAHPNSTAAKVQKLWLMW